MWSFANPWMLAWGLAAAAPILIHLWSRRRYVDAPWAAMDFLLAALRKSARRLRLEQVVLLTVRTLVLLLFAAALAEPMLAPSVGGGAAPRRSDQTHHILVFDSSYSMRFEQDGRSRFEAARQTASRLIADAPPRDVFSIVQMDDAPRLITPQPLLAEDSLAEELAALAPAYGGADLAQSLAIIGESIENAIGRRPHLTRARVCFFTDLDRAAWDAVASPQLQSVIETIAERAELELFDVGQPEAANAAVARVETRESLLTAGAEVEIEIEVAAFAAPARWGRGLQLLIDDVAVFDRRIEVDGADRVVERFTHRFEAPGPHVVEARLKQDALPVDDRRWLSVDVRGALRVLCVQGGPGAARYVSAALEAMTKRGVRIEQDVATENAFIQRDLDEYDCVVLCNVAGFQRGEARALHDYVVAGGGLIVFLGDRARPDNYNAELGAGARGLRVLPARLQGAARRGAYQLDPLNYRHSIAEPFRGRPRAGLPAVAVRQYVRLAPYDDAQATTAIAFTGGDPAIVEAPIGRGRSIMVATDVSDAPAGDADSREAAWSDLAAAPIFPPLMERMVALAAASDPLARNVRVGDVLSAPAGGAAELTIVRPADDGESSPSEVHLAVDPSKNRWAYAQTDVSGVYEVRRSRQDSGASLFAVNVDVAESSLERVEVQLLPAQLRIAGNRPRDEMESAGGDSPLYQYALTAVLLLLVLESCLAWRFGGASA